MLIGHILPVRGYFSFPNTKSTYHTLQTPAYRLATCTALAESCICCGNYEQVILKHELVTSTETMARQKKKEAKLKVLNR